MKNKIHILIIGTIGAILFNFLVASIASFSLREVGFNVTVGAAFAVIMVAAVRFGKAPKNAPVIFRTGVFQDVWVGWMLEALYSEFPFLDKMRDLSEYVNNDIINVREIGADPDVLINNNTYPIAVVERTDNNYPIGLDKYETVNTGINLKDSQRLNYDKVMSAISQHLSTLKQKTGEKWTHALGVMGSGANTPVLAATGADRGNGTRRLTTADVVRFATALDNLKVPSSDRVLILSANHAEDLVLEDINRFKALSDLKTGKLVDMFGFEIGKSIHTPKYHKGTLAKLAYGAAATANDTDASIMWHKNEAGFAKGSMTMHYLPKEMNTGFRRDEVGFSHFGITTLLRSKYCGAIVSPGI
jgi:hypothetical protein